MQTDASEPPDGSSAAGIEPAPAYALDAAAVAVHRRPLAARLAMWALGAGALAYAFIGVGVVGTTPRSAAAIAMALCAMATFVGGTVTGLGAALVALGGWMRPARVEVTRGTIRLRDRRGRTRTIARDEVSEGAVVPRAARSPRVDMRLGGGRTLSVEVPDAHRGDALLTALGLGPDRRRTTFEPVSRKRTVKASAGWGCLTYTALFIPALFIANAIGHGASRSPVPALAAMAAGALVALGVLVSPRAPTITVGADGLVVERAWRRRFVSLADVARAERTAAGIALVDAGGARQLIAVPRGDPEQLGAIAHRINEVLRARGQRADGAADPLPTAFEPAALARGDRPIAEWRQALARLLDAPTGFRDASIDRATLTALLEDAGAAVEQRLAAALALTSRRDPDAAERVRVAASAVADTRVRVALERVADGSVDEADLERALEAPSAHANESES